MLRVRYTNADFAILGLISVLRLQHIPTMCRSATESRNLPPFRDRHTDVASTESLFVLEQGWCFPSFWGRNC